MDQVLGGNRRPENFYPEFHERHSNKRTGLGHLVARAGAIIFDVARSQGRQIRAVWDGGIA